MNAQDIVNDTGIAAFARGPEGTITGWNRAIEAMLDLSANEVIGRPCHKVLEGSDELGIYCCRNCPSWRAAQKGLQIQPYRLQVSDGRGRRIGATVMVLVVPENAGLSLVHLVESEEEPGAVVALWNNIESMGMGGSFGSTRRSHPRELTFRELDIMHQLAVGRDASAIASRLLVGRAKVWQHISSCVRKLEARSGMV